MCMGGGGGGGGTITMPDTSAYDRMFDMQLMSMQSQYDGQMQQSQARLNSTLRDQQSALTDLASYRTERAEDVASVEADARRLSNLVGPPPPEESAKAPVIGTDRQSDSSTKGKRRLRIVRASQANGPGTGFNIT